MKERNKVANEEVNMQGETNMQEKGKIRKKEKMFAGGGTD